MTAEVFGECTVCHSYTPYATICPIVKSCREYNVSLVLVYWVNKCVCVCVCVALQGELEMAVVTGNPCPGHQ